MIFKFKVKYKENRKDSEGKIKLAPERRFNKERLKQLNLPTLDQKIERGQAGSKNIGCKRIKGSWKEDEKGRL